MANANQDPRKWSERNKLIAALSVVTALAIIGPLAVYFSTRSDDEVAGISTDAPTAVATTPPATEPSPTSIPTALPATAVQTPSPSATAAVPTPTQTPAATAAPEPTPSVQMLAGEEPGTYDLTGLASGSALNVRQAPGVTNPLVGTLAANATGIESTGRHASVNGGEWKEIEFGDVAAWVFAGYLTPAPASTPTPAPTVTPEPVVELPIEAAANYDIIGLSEGVSLSVHSLPGSDKPLLGTLPNNATEIPSTGRRVLIGTTEWREIVYQGSTGWSESRYLSLAPTQPDTVFLPTIAPDTIGIVALTSSTDRLSLHAEPGYDQGIVQTVASSAVNVAATGHRARIGTEEWIEIVVANRAGWVPKLLTTSDAPTWQTIVSSSGVALVDVDEVTVGDDGTIEMTFGDTTVAVRSDANIWHCCSGRFINLQDWAAHAVTATLAFPIEITVSQGEIIQLRVF